MTETKPMRRDDHLVCGDRDRERLMKDGSKSRIELGEEINVECEESEIGINMW